MEEGKDTGSKRLLSSVWQLLEEEGHDVEEIWEKIKETVRKCIISMEPYLRNYYRLHITKNEEKMKESKAFHIIGMDVLVDKKHNAWLMEINSNPSLNIFLEREVPGNPGQTEKVLQELDKHVKSKVVTEAIYIVTEEGIDEEFRGSFEQLLPVESGEMDEYYLWNDA